MTRHIANILTGCRIFGSLLLLRFLPFSAGFLITYLLCGFSDMIDGTVARRTNSTGAFGSKLDTAADLSFVAAALVKLLPALHLPQWLWLWGGVIAAIKISTLLWGYVSQKQLLSLHTRTNKVTGLLLFLLPLTRSFAKWTHIAAAVCAIATLSALQEGFCITDRVPR